MSLLDVAPIIFVGKTAFVFCFGGRKRHNAQRSRRIFAKPKFNRQRQRHQSTSFNFESGFARFQRTLSLLQQSRWSNGNLGFWFLVSGFWLMTMCYCINQKPETF